MKTAIALITAAVVGGVITFILMTWAFNKGCSIEVKMELPPSVKLDCAGAPHQVPLNFGSSPSKMPLKDALSAIADRTQGRGPARIWVDPDILKLPVAEVIVDPPAGPHLTLDVINQILAQAQVGESIGVVIVPQGGYRVQPLK